MKTGIAILALCGLMAAPIACVVIVCPVQDAHDCCPKSKSYVACPFDILASAKAALPAVAPVALESLAVPIECIGLVLPDSATENDRDLHLHNRVLRI